METFKKNKIVKGYFTVEASLIMPSVILLIACLLWLSFFLYDRCVFSQYAYIMAFRGSTLCGEKNERIEEYIKIKLPEQIGIKYFGIKDIENKIKADIKEVKVLLSGQMVTTGWRYKTEMKAERTCPVKYIRLIRIAEKDAEDKTEIESFKAEEK